MRVVFVHGACVRDGAWWWGPTAELLARRGIASTAPPLPSCGEAGAPAGADGPGFADDVTSVRAALTAGDEPAVVVAHSYGGVVAAQAAAGVAGVHHLLLVSSYLPEVGESLSSFAGPGPSPFLQVDAAGGTLSVDPRSLAPTFLQDCPGAVDGALPRLAPMSLSVVGSPVSAAAWKQVPSTYLVCTEDLGTPAAAQRTFARRAGAVVELSAGHHPFLSRPDAVADLVASLARDDHGAAV